MAASDFGFSYLVIFEVMMVFSKVDFSDILERIMVTGRRSHCNAHLFSTFINLVLKCLIQITLLAANPCDLQNVSNYL